MARASFLLRPRWILSHLFVATLVVVMVNLGFWQLDRLDQRRERNDLIVDRRDEPAVPVETLLSPDDDAEALDEVRFRAVTATGEYDETGTVVVRNRTMDGAPGVWLVTPLVLADGTEVGVVRGFVALGGAGTAEEPAPPPGEVTVEGAVLDPDGVDGTAPRDLAEVTGREDVRAGLVLAERSDPAEPADGSVLHPVGLPDLEEGPHLAYAVQWFIFATIALIGYPLTLRKLVRRQPGGEGDDEERRVLEREAEERSNGARRDDEEVLRQGG